jgi:hypothetical protein
VKFMVRALYNSCAIVCQVFFFGMKWDMSDVEPKIGKYISNYNNIIGDYAIREKNNQIFSLQLFL